jgi:hypothetical protein
LRGDCSRVTSRIESVVVCGGDVGFCMENVVVGQRSGVS